MACLDDVVRGLLAPFFLYISLMVNFLLISYLLQQPDLFGNNPALAWSRGAALEAEAAAKIQCSGHGNAFVDGVLDGGGVPVCECHKCYGGADCSEFIMDCPADVNSGDLLLMEQYWKRHAAVSAVVISGWHRMSYQANEKHYLSAELEKYIRILHKYVGNAITDDRFIVFGVGSSQLLNAAVYALSPENATSPAKVVAQVPYYPFYESQTEFYNSRAYEWVGAASNWVNASGSPAMNFVEFVAYPNNPDGYLVKPALNISSVIYDYAFYWPHYTAIPGPADEDIMLFSMSKISGHAGSRFGWALIRNEDMYNRFLEYVDNNNVGVGRDTQLRMLKVIKAMVAEKKGEEGDIFEFGYEALRKRWNRLNVIISSTKRFSIQSIAPQYCRYFQKIRDPSPAFAWLKCEMEDDEDCYEVFMAAGITPRKGTLFGESERYVRISMIKYDDDFELFLKRLEALISAEGTKTI